MTCDALPTLPALRKLGDLADLRPITVVDNREQTPLVLTRLRSVRGTLTTGDYSFQGGEHLFAVERKSIQDLVGCCVGDNRERFEKELHRLRDFRFKRLLVVGSEEDIQNGRYRSAISPKSVLATVNAFEVRHDVPVVYSPTPETAARLIEKWAWWAAREVIMAANNYCGARHPLRSLAHLGKVRRQRLVAEPQFAAASELADVERSLQPWCYRGRISSPHRSR